MERPKHFADGAKKGAGAALMGVGAGLASLVMLPVQGAREGGVGGAALGTAKGVGAFVGLSVLGVGAGVVQATRGALATPEYVKAKLAGKEWDKRLRRWIMYNLKEEAELVLSMTEAQYIEYLASDGKSALKKDGENAEGPASSNTADGSKAETRPTVKETGLYDTLGVTPDASAAQIKKAYYKMAKQYHPDKNPDDQQAKERFQEISNAYQVLSDDELRLKYDRGGKSGLEDAPKMDAKTFYTMMFGSEEFEPLVGKMDMLTMMGVEEDDADAAPAGMDPEMWEMSRVELAKWKREVTCAVNLADIVEPHVSGGLDNDAYRAKLEVLARELSASAVGASLLGVIGYCYKQQALRQIGDSAVSGGVSERLAGARATAEDTIHKAKNYASAASAGYAAATTAKAIEQEAKTKGEDAAAEDESKQALAAAKMVKVMWHATVIEVEALLQRVCKKVTHDTSVEKEVRRKRANSLIFAGEVFMDCSKKSGGMDAAMEELLHKIGAATAKPDTQ